MSGTPLPALPLFRNRRLPPIPHTHTVLFCTSHSDPHPYVHVRFPGIITPSWHPSLGRPALLGLPELRTDRCVCHFSKGRRVSVFCWFSQLASASSLLFLGFGVKGLLGTVLGPREPWQGKPLSPSLLSLSSPQLV